MYSWLSVYMKYLLVNILYTTSGITPSFCRVQLYVSSNWNTSLVESWSYWIFSWEILPCSISWRWGSAMCMHVYRLVLMVLGVRYVSSIYCSFCLVDSMSPVEWISYRLCYADVQITWILLVYFSPDSTWSERKHPLFSSSGWQRRVFTQTCLVLAILLILKQPWLMQLPSTKGAKAHTDCQTTVTQTINLWMSIMDGWVATVLSCLSQLIGDFDNTGGGVT